MTDPNEKEMLAELSKMSDCRLDSLDQKADLGELKRHYEIRDAIRRLIKEQEKREKQADELIKAAEAVDHEVWEEMVMDFLRSFGEEEK